jgi:hypothetical protein
MSYLFKKTKTQSTNRIQRTKKFVLGMSSIIKYLLHAVFLDMILLNHSLALISEIGLLGGIYTVPLSVEKNLAKGDYKKHVCQWLIQ